jgi:hypothetical protein
MNEIFIILNDEYSFVELIFENFKNEFIFKNKIYKFEFIDKYKLKIFNIEENYILETKDSFIFTSNISSLLLFKLITLNHNEWFDQAILNYENNLIIRIKDRNQYGNFKFEENKLKIVWDYWGEEIFEKYDENIYNHICLKRYDLKQNIITFIHLCNLGDGYDIFLNQYERLKKSKIYDNIKYIYICLIGKYEDKIKQMKQYEKIKIIHLHEDVSYYEFLTINKIKEFVDNDDKNYNILYFHNKGTRNAGNKDVTKSWREMMEYFLIDKGEYCINNLDYYDTIGCNILNKNEDKISNINNNHCYHYSGNFWWSKSDHIRTLLKLEISKDKKERDKKRFICENWLLSNIDNSNSKNIGIIYQDNTNIHPYHRYIFDNYKNNKLLINKLNIK